METRRHNVAKTTELTAKIDAYIKANPKFWIKDLRDHLGVKNNFPFQASYEYQLIYRIINKYKKQGMLKLINSIGNARRYEVVVEEDCDQSAADDYLDYLSERW